MTAMEDVAEIQRLLVEAYDKYFAEGDGYCKSSEAAIELNWPTYWDIKDGKNEPSCGVYSYVFGPSRMHYFDTTTLALAEVRKWHERAMARSYREDDDS